MNLRESIIKILSDKKAKREGLHVKHIARHVHNSNNSLFTDEPVIEFEKLMLRINRILLYDVNKKRKGMFVRVVNPKTGKYRKGFYKLKNQKKKYQRTKFISNT
jgi:hypothetical protein